MYDIFISFKYMGEDGKPTRDSVIAREIYDKLTDRGFKVFFSTVTLEKLGISAYKYAIDKALDSASIMIVVGISAENLDSQWVRYEWDSFFNDIISGIKPEGRVFTYIEGCSIKSLPRVLRQAQVFKHSDETEKLINFVTNSLSDKISEKTAKVIVEKEGSKNPVKPEPKKANEYKFTFQRDYEERYGKEAVQLVDAYPFLRDHWSVSDQERIYCLTGRKTASLDKEAVCRICGNIQEWDRYPSLELPRVCPDCGFDGDYSSRIFVAYASSDSLLAKVIMTELNNGQFRVKKSGIAKTSGGFLDEKRLKIKLSACGACIVIWSDQSSEDNELNSEISVVRSLNMPVLFFKVGKDTPKTIQDTDRIIDLREYRNWDRILINAVCDCLAVDERRKNTAK